MAVVPRLIARRLLPQRHLSETSRVTTANNVSMYYVVNGLLEQAHQALINSKAAVLYTQGRGPIVLF